MKQNITLLDSGILSKVQRLEIILLSGALPDNVLYKINWIEQKANRRWIQTHMVNTKGDRISH